jgi:hypothetical protein
MADEFIPETFILRPPVDETIFQSMENGWSFIGDWVIATDSLSSFAGSQPQYKRSVQMASVDGVTSFDPDNEGEKLTEFAKCLKHICENKLKNLEELAMIDSDFQYREPRALPKKNKRPIRAMVGLFEKHYQNYKRSRK